MSKSITVIIPIYNVEAYIADCIKSLAEQTYKGFDIIAVDDCCTDDSIKTMLDAINTYTLPKERIHIVRHERNRGLSAARNTGIKESKADYVFFLDSDDTISKDCIELMHNTIEMYDAKGTSVDMVIGDYAFDGPEIGCPKLTAPEGILNRKKYIKEYCKQHVYPMAWNRMTKREFVLNNNLLFEEGLIHEDTLWNFMLLKYLKNVVTIKRETYIYRVRPNSIQSSDNYKKHFDANIYILGKLCDIQFSTWFLKFNRYVYDFVEQEKLRHLYDCYHNNCPMFIPQLYSVCRKHKHLTPWQARMICFPNKGLLEKISKRDKHYSLAYDEGLKLFTNLPNTL